MIWLSLADDHPIVCQGLRALLGAGDGCDIVGEASDGLTEIDLIARLQPDVAVLDVQPPALNGLGMPRRLRVQVPPTRVVMLLRFADERSVVSSHRPV
ncbi:MAG: response regulator transcription factor [Thermomicrobiales bacterium]